RPKRPAGGAASGAAEGAQAGSAEGGSEPQRSPSPGRVGALQQQASRWRALPDAERQRYRELAARDKERFERELQAWRAEQPEEAGLADAAGPSCKRRRKGQGSQGPGCSTRGLSAYAMSGFAVGVPGPRC
ncbi:unnamed protein product, partial [Prorocentrum cordatum]